MSEGFKVLEAEVSSTGKPSITNKGEFSCVKELLPRITIFIVPPGIPSPDVTFTPAIRPPNAWSNEATGAVRTSFMLALATEPVKSRLRTS